MPTKYLRNDANQVFEIGPKPVQVRHAATGVMLADVSVFSALTKAFPEKRYKPNLTYQPNLELLLERGSAEGPFPTRRKTKWKMILAAIWRKK
jgi:hypothetical protein